VTREQIHVFNATRVSSDATVKLLAKIATAKTKATALALDIARSALRGGDVVMSKPNGVDEFRQFEYFSTTNIVC